ncbi:MAG TPA: hypothetical protein VHC69_35085 [Polyangiaceae bacterium]|nr:hypothetical protein [Polyangiaceae bacterium]
MSDAPQVSELKGELTAPPRGVLGTLLITLSGLSLLRGGARWIGRLALGYRHPAELRLSDRGLQISARSELLGRVLSESETLIPLANLSSITREVRFARLGLYAGLLALVAGTYVGVGLLVDGVRVPGGSPSLLGLGLAAIALGIVLDYVLAVVLRTVAKKCRVVIVPVHGRSLCVEGLDPTITDAVLATIASTLAASTPDAAASASVSAA